MTSKAWRNALIAGAIAWALIAVAVTLAGRALT